MRNERGNPRRIALEIRFVPLTCIKAPVKKASHVNRSESMVVVDMASL